MSFVPPPGPPPPSVPAGWKAQFDDRYQQWFFVNLHTGKSQWQPPEAPAQAEEAAHGPPSEPPPLCDNSDPQDPAAVASTGDKKPLMGSNNPYNPTRTGESTLDSDARLAAQLQAEEDARAGKRSPGVPGAAADYYDRFSRPQSGQGISAPQSPMPQSAPAEKQSRSKGFLSKLMGKSSSSGSSSASYSRPPQHHQPYSYQQGGYNYQQGGHPGPYQGGYYPPQQPGYAYGGYPAQGGYYAQQQRHRKGMNPAAAAALGVGGGLLGGALLANALDDDDHHYEGDQGGEDFGGGDDFGGDF